MGSTGSNSSSHTAPPALPRRRAGFGQRAPRVIKGSLRGRSNLDVEGDDGDFGSLVGFRLARGEAGMSGNFET